MSTEKYSSWVIGKLEVAVNHNQVEDILSTAITDITLEGDAGMIRSFLSQLQAQIEELSPLDWNSTQWGCFRYALIYLRKHAVTEPA